MRLTCDRCHTEWETRWIRGGYCLDCRLDEAPHPSRPTFTPALPGTDCVACGAPHPRWRGELCRRCEQDI